MIAAHNPWELPIRERLSAAQAEESLASRHRGGKFKINVYRKESFAGTRNYEVRGEPR